MNVFVIIPAAGRSTRFGGGVIGGKLGETIAGEPVLHHAVRTLAADTRVGSLIVAGPHDTAAFDAFRDRHGGCLASVGATLCRGGAEHRWQSVRAAFEHADAEATHVAVHDAARPCVSRDLIDRVFSAARSHDAVVPAVDAADTVRRVSDGATPGVRTAFEEVDRRGLVLVQTPQVFARPLFERAYAQPDLTSTDDAGLVARLGERITIVAGDPTNIKITRQPDLELARAIMLTRAAD